MYFCVYLKKKTPEKPLFSGVLFSTVLRYGSLLAGTKISQPAKASCDIGCGNLPLVEARGVPPQPLAALRPRPFADAPFGRSSATGGVLFRFGSPAFHINKKPMQQHGLFIYGGGEGSRTPVRRRLFTVFSERSGSIKFPHPFLDAAREGSW